MKKVYFLCCVFALLWSGSAYAGEVGFADAPSQLPFHISRDGELTFHVSSEHEYEVEVLSSVHGQLFKGNPGGKDSAPVILQLPADGRENDFLLVINISVDESPYVTYMGDYVCDARIKYGSFFRVDRENGELATVNEVNVDDNAIIPQSDGTLVFYSREAELRPADGNAQTSYGCGTVMNVEKGVRIPFEGGLGDDYVCYLFTGDPNPDAIEVDAELWDSSQANCYSYAVNLSPDVWLNAGSRLLWDVMEEEQPEYRNLLLKEQVLFDMRLFEKTDYWTSAPDGYYKIAAFYGQSHAWDSFKEDMHFYRQNPNGTWSHKLGASDVMVYDAGGQIIYNPQLANRSERALYNQFLGYYLVPDNLYNKQETVTPGAIQNQDGRAQGR